MADLRLELVTPETTVLDAPVTALQVPMFDGQAGILPGHSAMVGRLGAGKLTVKLAAPNEEGKSEVVYFIDGGFAQIKQGVVALLTQRAVPLEQLDAAAAAKELEAARTMKAVGEEELDARQHAQERARRMLALAR